MKFLLQDWKHFQYKMYYLTIEVYRRNMARFPLNISLSSLAHNLKYHELLDLQYSHNINNKFQLIEPIGKPRVIFVEMVLNNYSSSFFNSSR